MKHKYVKYVWNNTWQCFPDRGVWCREKDRVGRVDISTCNLGEYVLNLKLFCTYSIQMDFNSPLIWGYDFSIRTALEGECILSHSLHEGGLYFDTLDIDEAERTAEYVWKHTLFS